MALPHLLGSCWDWPTGADWPEGHQKGLQVKEKTGRQQDDALSVSSAKERGGGGAAVPSASSEGEWDESACRHGEGRSAADHIVCCLVFLGGIYSRTTTSEPTNVLIKSLALVNSQRISLLCAESTWPSNEECKIILLRGRAMTFTYHSTGSHSMGYSAVVLYSWVSKVYIEKDVLFVLKLGAFCWRRL